mmetsp:Transcript_123836/g.185077  ORF Transcript_123836/g.185077 Transcript_123836/m.185077 type:complete len:119 (-) Transcript_123836:194-550(-)
MGEYENFDDYLEVILNVGYITLFASSFATAPAIMFVFHMLEKYSDRYKLLKTYRRPMPFKSKGIGYWWGVLNVLSIACVFSNIVLFAFSSEKIVDFFPSFFKDAPNTASDVISNPENY